ncbi:Uncharacterised protein [Wolbachia endosymbiont wPip_Mol of Culex molestus]|nr:Uncharacterised protein [Wolbachia endosymbiont wPip_Mol of Culex molestus]
MPTVVDVILLILVSSKLCDFLQYKINFPSTWKKLLTLKISALKISLYLVFT